MSDLFVIRMIQERLALKMGAPELCCQTAEEAAELIQALMQYRRVEGMGQPTDKCLQEVRENMQEEIVDVIICLKQLVFLMGFDYDYMVEIEQEKIKRTVKRYNLEVE